MLNPHSPMPLYQQLADVITAQIRSGTYRSGDAIPSETGMAKHYGIGRPTVRQAMDILVRNGLVERKRGSGTFVKHKEHHVDLFSLTGTSQAFLTKGITTTSKNIAPVGLRNIHRDQANPFSRKTALFFSRITFVKSDPILLEEFWFHPQLFSGLEKMDLENRSISQVVSEQYYLKPQTGHQTFKISFLPDSRAKLLGVDPLFPLLEVERTLDFPGAEGAVFSRLFCRTDIFAFSQTICLEMPWEQTGKRTIP